MILTHRQSSEHGEVLGKELLINVIFLVFFVLDLDFLLGGHFWFDLGYNLRELAGFLSLEHLDDIVVFRLRLLDHFFISLRYSWGKWRYLLRSWFLD